MTAEQVQEAVVQGATALVLQVAEREVPKPDNAELAIATARTAGSWCRQQSLPRTVPFFGRGLNQVGHGFVSMAVQHFQVPALRRASLIAIGQHGGQQSFRMGLWA